MNAQTNLWYYRPAWLRLFLWELDRTAETLLSVSGKMNGKHYRIRLR